MRANFPQPPAYREVIQPYARHHIFEPTEPVAEAFTRLLGPEVAVPKYAGAIVLARGKLDADSPYVYHPWRSDFLPGNSYTTGHLGDRHTQIIGQVEQAPNAQTKLERPYLKAYVWPVWDEADVVRYTLLLTQPITSHGARNAADRGGLLEDHAVYAPAQTDQSEAARWVAGSHGQLLSAVDWSPVTP
jgi:hypothetical protein